jgi:hypothetical protein
MRLRLLKSGDISLTQLNPLEAEALLSIPKNADASETPEAQVRLFPPLVSDDSMTDDPLEVESMEEDWTEYVVPDLKELFDHSLESVQENLKKLTPSPPEIEEPEGGIPEDGVEIPQLSGIPIFKLTIPRDKVEDWFRAMNQARLVMVEKTLWVEENGDLHGPIISQIHYEIYTFIQQWLVEHVMSGE